MYNQQHNYSKRLDNARKTAVAGFCVAGALLLMLVLSISDGNFYCRKAEKEEEKAMRWMHKADSLEYQLMKADAEIVAMGGCHE